MTDREPVDQGTVYWPAGLPADEVYHLTFNRALPARPARIECTLLESGEPLAVEIVDIPIVGTRQFAHHDHAIIRLTDPAQRRRSFRWRVYE